MTVIGDERFHAAMASPSRRGVLAAVAAASIDGDGVDAATLAARLDLHVTTVRFHLEQLEAVALVWRVPSAERRRGRPRVLFAAHETSEQREAPRQREAPQRGEEAPQRSDARERSALRRRSEVRRRSEATRRADAAAAAGSEFEGDAAHRSQLELIRVLAAALAERPGLDGDRGRAAAIDAGRAWGRARAAGDRAADEARAVSARVSGEEREAGDRLLEAASADGGRASQQAGGAGDRVPREARAEALLRTLDSLGFAPERREREVLLHGCPFRDAAREHPDIVCGAHLGLIREVMADRHDAVRLQPMAQPSLCVVSLGQVGATSAQPRGASPSSATARRPRRPSPTPSTRGSGAA